MSYLELTLYAYRRPLEKADSWSLKEKKLFIEISLVILGITVVSYLCMLGLLVENHSKEVSLSKTLKNELHLAQDAESQSIFKKSTIDTAFFKTAGFEESKGLDVLKRTQNVAEASKKNIF
jgi:hypothetical protein